MCKHVIFIIKNVVKNCYNNFMFLSSLVGKTLNSSVAYLFTDCLKVEAS